MTHEDAIDTLLAKTAEPIARDRAEQHVSACKDCWEVVRLLADVTEGTAAADALFGCDRVRGRLYLLSGLTPEEASRRQPEIARHVRYCRSCRSDLRLFLQVERDVAQGVYDEVMEVDAPSQRVPWAHVLGAAGERICELAEQFAFRLHERLITPISWPEGLEMTPVGAMAMRGSASNPGGTEGSQLVVNAPGHRFQLDLDKATLDVDLVVETQSEDRVRLEVRVLRGQRSVSMTLRRVEIDREVLISAQDASPTKAFVASNLLPGTYQLDVREQPTAERRRVRFSIERG